MFDLLKLWLLGVLAVVVVVFTIGGISMLTKGTFLPWSESIRRETFEQSQSYVQGKIAYLNRLRQDHAGADTDAHRCAIRATALHEASTATELAPDLSGWIDTLKENPCEQ